MIEDLYNDEDPNLITDKSHRLPECLHRNEIYRNAPSEKAKLFDTHFYDQFSNPSYHRIDIDWYNDSINDVEFSESNIRRLSSNIDSNKVSGPDGIHGQILKIVLVFLHFPFLLLINYPI